MPDSDRPIPRWRLAIRHTLYNADAEALAHLSASAGRPDYRTIIVLVTTAIALTLQEYLFSSNQLFDFFRLLDSLGLEPLADAARRNLITYDNLEITQMSYWAIGRLITYVVLPLLVIRFLLREPVSNFGISVKGCVHSLPLYIGMFVVMFPAVYFFSHTESFQASYPFYQLNPDEKLWPRFWMWEVLYAIQFVALEFFFRGFVLHGTRHRAGSSAILVMMVPYCMIHFQKPMPETFGAIGAGIILGFMSLKTRSIWLGAALHIAVALSMDLLALAHR